MFSRVVALIVLIAAFFNLAVNAAGDGQVKPLWAKDGKVMGDVEFARKFPNQKDTSKRKRVLQNGDTASSYRDDPFGLASLFLSEAAYCSSLGGGSFMDIDYTQIPRVGDFVPTSEFVVGSDGSITGFVGYQPSVGAIWVVFRGSSDIENWITNFDFVRQSYPLGGCSGCSVHEGFYQAEQQAIQRIANAVSSLINTYPNYQIVVAGHSLGAALATLTALDLAVTYGYGSGVSVYNYGSPRIFNENGANFASSGVINIAARRTHCDDPVPHLPQEIFGYRHIDDEIYEGCSIAQFPRGSGGGQLKTCYGQEDPNCADQFDGTVIADHLLYGGIAMGSDGCQYLYSGTR